MATMSAEHPILFRAEMIRAILEGRKTQTRRVGKIQSDSYTELGVEYSNHATKGRQPVATYRAYPTGGTARWGICTCPYGPPGDRLWVKESHYRYGQWVKNGFSTAGKQKWKFKALDKRVIFAATGSLPTQHKLERGDIGWHLRPSIYMPRWASRITLEIERIRVERVRQINWCDAIAEGMHDPYRCKIRVNNSDPRSPVAQFQKLWNTMRAETEFAWEKNPWVWVVEFSIAPF
jgi:hypothetical protein